MAPASVAHVTAAHHPHDARIYLKECLSLAELGIPIHLIAPGAGGCPPPLDGRIDFTLIKRRSSRIQRLFLSQHDLWRALKAVEPRLVHIHDPELVPLALLWRLLHGSRIIYDAHEDLEKQVMSKDYIPISARPLLRLVARAIERVADRLFDAIVVAEESYLPKFANSRTLLVQNYPRLRDYPEERIASSTTDPCRVVYVGGISKARGVVRMLQAVSDSTASPHLYLAGPIYDARPEGWIESQDAAITYLGHLSSQDIPEVIFGSTVGLCVLEPLPNYVNSMPTKLFEYMAAGIPFVASDIGAWRSLFEPFDCGTFVDPLDTDAIRAAIDRYLLDPTIATEHGHRGREAFLEHFTFEQRSAAKLFDLTMDLHSYGG